MLTLCSFHCYFMYLHFLHVSSFIHRRNFVCDDDDFSPPLFQSGICNFSSRMTLPEAFCGLTYAENAIAAGAPPWTPLRELTALPRPPNRLGSGHPSPYPTPLGASMLAPSARRSSCPPDTKSWRRHWSPPLSKVKLRQCIVLQLLYIFILSIYF